MHVTGTYLREELGGHQGAPVECHVGEYDGREFSFHSHANNAQNLGNDLYTVASFTVTARPAVGGIGHPGYHVNCAEAPDGTWGKVVAGGPLPETQAALLQLADEIIVDMDERRPGVQAKVDENRRQNDRKDRDDRKLRRTLGLEPGSGTKSK